MRCMSFLLKLVVITAMPTIALASATFGNPELPSGYIAVVDERGMIILQTGIVVNSGDEYISEDNKLYEITAVEGTLAKARYIRDESLATTDYQAVPALAPDSLSPDRLQTPSPPATGQLISLYYTHSDEAYIPTDGRAAISGNGSIYKVGAIFAQRLSELGFQVDNNQTRHDPHDANAYQRSRRTFIKLLEKQPAALFDVHRDSAPLKDYQITVNGQPAAKILLVVGRQNQNRQTTMNYSKSIKAAADSKYKGLIRGIFIAHGSYNQDLNPRAMLIEIGTQYNSLDAAERSAALFADAVPLFLFQPAGSAAAAPSDQSLYRRNTTYDILIIIGLLAAGTAAFLFLSTGSWQETKRKLAHFKEFEFINFLAPRSKRKK